MGLAHATVTVRVSGTFVRRQRVILTAAGPFEPLIKYFVDNEVLSFGWQTGVALAVGLLIDFMHALGDRYIGELKANSLLPDFFRALRDGTVSDGEDATGLYWTGLSKERARLLLTYVCNFSDEVVRVSGARGLGTERPATVGEQIAYWRRWNAGRATDIQRHQAPNARTRENAKTAARVTRGRLTPVRGEVPTKRFADNLILDLLFKGFVTEVKGKRLAPWQRYNLRDILITILMHGGGLRVSEAFHLFLNDVVEDPVTPGTALVRVYHPEHGTIRWKDPLTHRDIVTDRKRFLKDVYGRQPRNRVTGGEFAGWKNPALTEAREGKYIQVFWFPAVWGDMFWKIYRAYVLQVYPRHRLDHPYLFVSLNAKHYGKPYTPAAFTNNHAAAIRRIGMTPGKHLGTTPHGHRHAMGARMNSRQVSGKVQTLTLHHASPLSRLIYNEWNASEINQELARLSQDAPGAVDIARYTTERLESDIDAFLTNRDPTHQLTHSRR